MPDLGTFALFALTSFAIVATPGPGVLYIVGRSVDQGRRAGLTSMLGIEAAEVVWVLAAALGLSALLASSAEAFDVLRYGGAAYLVYLGVQRWRRAADEAEDVTPPASAGRLFGEGFVVQMLNPKVALFFVAFFPQFVEPGSAVLPQVLVLGAVYVAVAVVSDGAYILLAAGLAERLRRSRRVRLRFARGSAITYVALGAFAALSGSRTAKA